MEASRPTGAKHISKIRPNGEDSPPKRPKRGDEALISPRQIGYVDKDFRAPLCTKNFNEPDINGVNLNHSFGITSGEMRPAALPESQSLSAHSAGTISSEASSIARFSRRALPPNLQGFGGCHGALASADGSSSAAASADSSIGIVPAASESFVTPPGTPPGTTDVGQCKGGGYVTEDGRWYVKPPFRDPDIKDQQTPGSFFNKSVKNALFEFIWMDEVKSFLDKNPITIEVQGTAYTVHVVPTELTNKFEFKQPNIEKDSMNPELKKEMSGQMLKVMLPQLWKEGLITALDIKPDNFHVSGNEIHIFDLYFPQNLIDSEENLRLQICHQCKVHTLLQVNEYNQLTDDLFKSHLNHDAARKFATNSKATCDKLISQHQKGINHYYESLTRELTTAPPIKVNEYGLLELLEKCITPAPT